MEEVIIRNHLIDLLDNHDETGQQLKIVARNYSRNNNISVWK